MIHLENKTIAFAWELSDEILKAIEEGQSMRSRRANVPFDRYETILIDNPNCCELYVSNSDYSAKAVPWAETEKEAQEDEGTVIVKYEGMFEALIGEIKRGNTSFSFNLNHCK